MMTRTLIGLAGKAGAGKDSAADTLCRTFCFHRHSFAAPLKSMAKELGLTDAQLHDPALKEAPIDWLDGITPRRILQTLGTDWGRAMIHPDIWLRIAERTIRITFGDLVITDVRFDNEARLIRALGGQIWHIHRTCTTAVPEHVSEAGIQTDIADIHIHNNGTLADLYDAVVNLILGQEP